MFATPAIALIPSVLIFSILFIPIIHLNILISLIMFTTPAIAPISSVLIFSILFLPIIHLNILMSVLSSKSWSAFLSAQVSLPYIRSELMSASFNINNLLSVVVLYLQWHINFNSLHAFKLSNASDNFTDSWAFC